MKRLIMKRILITSITLSLIALSGCRQENLSKSNEYFPEWNAKKEAKVYFEYLKEKDIQKLSKLFSLEIQNSHDLEKEWTTFFSALDGNITSYENISTHGEEMYVDNRVVTFSGLTIRFENVQTDTGKIYELIDYYEIRVDAKHKNAEGISLFSVLLPYEDDMVNKEVAVGEIFDK